MTTDARYAGLVSRGIAFTFDAVVVVAACTLGARVSIAVMATVRVGDVSDTGQSGGFGLLIAVPAVFWAYCAGFWALVGRTPGMMLLGLRVVTVDGESPSLGRSVVRACGYWLSAIALVGFLWIAVDKRSQGFHDKLARTVVVFDDEPARAVRA